VIWVGTDRLKGLLDNKYPYLAKIRRTTDLFTSTINLVHILFGKVLFSGVNGTFRVTDEDLQRCQLVVEVCAVVATRTRFKPVTFAKDINNQ